MTGAGLQVLHATKRYSGATTDALSDVTFGVEAGAVCCVIGRNGAGKSTLMSSIVGLTRLNEGSVTLGGESLPDSAELRRRVGFAAQSEALYPLLSGRENLTMFGRLAGLGRSELRARVADVAQRLSIADLLDQPVRQLSGGERRRVHVAAALISDVDVVMLDEPTAGVDPVTRSNVLDLVRVVADQGAIVVYSTHYLQEVEALDGQIVMLERGRVVASGAVSAVLARHGTSTVEMEFAEPIDVSTSPWNAEWEGSTLRIDVTQPNEELPRILQHLGAATLHLRSLQVVEPTLDRVFMELTGMGLREDEGLPL
ncbi:MAG: ABC transporter ATP-binding protein [Microthrixaceae bacterium]|nr:ABC transporter ATP-binding protein [Microthrixaceae bacterium]